MSVIDVSLDGHWSLIASEVEWNRWTCWLIGDIETNEKHDRCTTRQCERTMHRKKDTARQFERQEPRRANKEKVLIKMHAKNLRSFE